MLFLIKAGEAGNIFSTCLVPGLVLMKCQNIRDSVLIYFIDIVCEVTKREIHQAPRMDCKH